MTSNPPEAHPRPVVAWLRSYKWPVLIAILACGLGGWQGVRMIRGPLLDVDRVARGDLIETVVASGHIETPFRVEIASQIVGVTETVAVTEGQQVVKGQTLVLLESRELQTAVLQAQGVVAQSEARMRQFAELTLPTARATLREARATMLNMQQIFDRTATLAHDGFATRVALDEAQKNLDVARTQIRTAEVQVYSSGPGGSDFVMGQTLLTQAIANRATAISRLGYATIVAPRDGVLVSRAVEQGSVVQPGKLLFVLAPEGETQIVLQIDERNLGKLALTQPALASADAYPERRFPAQVTYINPGIDIARASVEVKLTVATPPTYLRQDMTVSVDIEIARRTGVLVLPGRSVHDSLSAEPWVMRIVDGHAVRQNVRLGLQGNTRIEILQGLNEGDAVIPAATTIKSGERVRPMTS